MKTKEEFERNMYFLLFVIFGPQVSNQNLGAPKEKAEDNREPTSQVMAEGTNKFPDFKGLFTQLQDNSEGGDGNLLSNLVRILNSQENRFAQKNIIENNIMGVSKKKHSGSISMLRNEPGDEKTIEFPPSYQTKGNMRPIAGNHDDLNRDDINCQLNKDKENVLDEYYRDDISINNKNCTVDLFRGRTDSLDSKIFLGAKKLKLDTNLELNKLESFQSNDRSCFLQEPSSNLFGLMDSPKDDKQSHSLDGYSTRNLGKNSEDLNDFLNLKRLRSNDGSMSLEEHAELK